MKNLLKDLSNGLFTLVCLSLGQFFISLSNARAGEAAHDLRRISLFFYKIWAKRFLIECGVEIDSLFQNYY